MKHFRLVTYSILLEMHTSQAHLTVRQVHSLCFSSSAVTLKALWLRVDFWYCAIWNLRPHFEVLYYSWSVRGEHGREETERWITVFWKWYGNLVMWWFTAYHLWVLQYRNGCDIQGFTDSHQHCWRPLGKSRCRFVFVCAFRINGADCKTEESFKVYNLWTMPRK